MRTKIIASKSIVFAFFCLAFGANAETLSDIKDGFVAENARLTLECFSCTAELAEVKNRQRDEYWLTMVDASKPEGSRSTAPKQKRFTTYFLGRVKAFTKLLLDQLDLCAQTRRKCRAVITEEPAEVKAFDLALVNMGRSALEQLQQFMPIPEVIEIMQSRLPVKAFENYMESYLAFLKEPSADSHEINFKARMLRYKKLDSQSAL